MTVVLRSADIKHGQAGSTVGLACTGCQGHLERCHLALHSLPDMDWHIITWWWQFGNFYLYQASQILILLLRASSNSSDTRLNSFKKPDGRNEEVTLFWVDLDLTLVEGPTLNPDLW